MATTKDRVIVELVAEAKGFNRAMKQANRSLREIDRSARSTAMSLRFFREVTGIATMAIMVRELGEAFLKTNIAIQQNEKAFKAVFGTAEVGARELEYVKLVANEMGVGFLELSKSYASLSAAAKGTALEGKQTRGIFEAVTRAMGKLGKSTADTEGALKAIEQMISKGTITAEEWKGQLGERLPGAMQILANALGKTTSEIMSMMEAGDIISTKTLPKVTEEINRLYDNGQRIEGLLPAWNRFKNAVTEVVKEVDDAVGITDALAKSLESLTSVLDGTARESYKAKGAVKQVTEQLAEQQWVLGTLLEMWIKYRAVSNGNVGPQSKPIGTHPITGETIGGPISYSPVGGLAPTSLVDRILSEAKLIAELDKAVEAEKKVAADTVIAGNMAWAEKQRWSDRTQARRGTSGRTRGGGGPSPYELEVQRITRAYENLRASLDPLVRIEQDMLRQLNTLDEAKAAKIEGVAESYDELTKKIVENAQQATDAIQNEAKEVSQLGEEIGSSFTRAFADIVTGADSASDALRSLLRALGSSVVSAGFKPLENAISTGLGAALKLADGGVTSTGLPHGVYSRPTPFAINGPSRRFATGTGLLGEAGPEAILPLKRRNGKLGVEGGGTNVTVHNYAGAAVDVNQGANPGDIDIIVRRVADDITRGGGMVGRSIEGAYGLTRGKGRR